MMVDVLTTPAPRIGWLRGERFVGLSNGSGNGVLGQASCHRARLTPESVARQKVGFVATFAWSNIK
jgi:hypothetical protein